jgi:hypothetical protein
MVERRGERGGGEMACYRAGRRGVVVMRREGGLIAIVAAVRERWVGWQTDCHSMLIR